MVRDVGHDELSNEDRAAPPESMRKLVEKPDGRGLARQLDDPLSLRAQFRTCFGLGGFIGGRGGAKRRQTLWWAGQVKHGRSATGLLIPSLALSTTKGFAKNGWNVLFESVSGG